GAGRRIGDHGVADLEARLALEIMEARGDLLALEVLDGVADQEVGQQADQPDDDDLEHPAADDRVVPWRDLHLGRGAQRLDGHALVSLSGLAGGTAGTPWATTVARCARD